MPTIVEQQATMSISTNIEITTSAQGDELPTYREAQPAMPVPTVANTNGGPLSTSHKSALLDDSGKHEWLILRTTTRPRKPESLPIFETRDIIKGEVEMNTSQKIANGMKSLTVSIVGIVTRLNYDPHTFFKQTLVLWTPALAPVPTLGQYDSGKGKPGIKHTWPFSFTVPERIKVDGTECNVPPTLTLRSSPVSIEYRLTVQAKRQGVFKPSKTLATPFGYRLATFAEQPSELRRAWLRDGGMVLGPDVDTEGWKVLPSVCVKGLLQGRTQPCEVELTLAISRPTTYPVGSPVPLLLTLMSSDSQALDVLATPSALGLELVRTILTTSPQDAGKKGNTKKPYSEGEVFAVWWPDSTINTENNSARRFRGELNVPVSTIPSFVFPRCEVAYTLDFQPPSSPRWTAHPASAEHPPPIVSEPITIVAKQALGVPKARSTAPPGYKDESGANFRRILGKSSLVAGFF